ncbi:MAG: domain containing rane protein [Deltaproteobacteria bacterium]|nr:domain containing rane protein [Deltaproteobacteria bacterium]
MNGAANTMPEKTVGTVMTTDPVTLQLNDTLRLADDMMNLAHVRHFPVFDGEKLVGVIDQDDLLHASMAALVRHPKDKVREALGAVAIKDFMKAATTVPRQTSIYDAARMMVDRGMECLLVVDGDKLVGVVTRSDLLRELAKR